MQNTAYVLQQPSDDKVRQIYRTCIASKKIRKFKTANSPSARSRLMKSLVKRVLTSTNMTSCHKKSTQSLVHINQYSGQKFRRHWVAPTTVKLHEAEVFLLVMLERMEDSPRERREFDFPPGPNSLKGRLINHAACQTMV